MPQALVLKAWQFSLRWRSGERPERQRLLPGTSGQMEIRGRVPFFIPFFDPVRAEMVAHPRDYRWSSYRANAEGEGDDVVSPHPLYLALAADNESRLRAYRKLFSDALDPGDEAAIREAISHNHFLGDEDFRMKLERLAGRPVSASSRGRPSRQKEQAVDGESTEQQRSLDLV